jgi:hypothetical protein
MWSSIASSWERSNLSAFREVCLERLVFLDCYFVCLMTFPKSYRWTDLNLTADECSIWWSVQIVCDCRSVQDALFGDNHLLDRANLILGSKEMFSCLSFFLINLCSNMVCMVIIMAGSMQRNERLFFESGSIDCAPQQLCCWNEGTIFFITSDVFLIQRESERGACFRPRLEIQLFLTSTEETDDPDCSEVPLIRSIQFIYDSGLRLIEMKEFTGRESRVFSLLKLTAILSGAVFIDYWSCKSIRSDSQSFWQVIESESVFAVPFSWYSYVHF